jgi:ABC-type sugar transport system substrate-binding protein
MDKTLFVLLLGDDKGDPVDLFQDLMRKEARSRGAAAGFRVDVACAPGYDQYRVLRKRLADTSSPVDAVLTEPASVSTMQLILKELKGRTGLILMNAWDAVVEQYVKDWGAGFPIGAVSTPHVEVGEIQGRQASAVVPQGGGVLVVTGPPRSSAAPERLQGFRSTIRSDIKVYDAEGGQWAEAAGILAFNGWYGVFKSRREEIHAIVGQSDDLAVGALEASRAVANPEHVRMFAGAKLFGVGCCPGYGKDRVDDGTLQASVVLPPTTVKAVELLKGFWGHGRPIPNRSFAEVVPYPSGSVGAP